jgi:hypothetical protein
VPAISHPSRYFSERAFIDILCGSVHEEILCHH